MKFKMLSIVALVFLTTVIFGAGSADVGLRSLSADPPPGDGMIKIRGLFVMGKTKSTEEDKFVKAFAKHDLRELTEYMDAPGDSNRHNKKNSAWKKARLPGSGWVGAYHPKTPPNSEELKKDVIKLAGDADDIFLFVFDGHGRKNESDQNGDEPQGDKQWIVENWGPTGCKPECDEFIVAGDDIRDDDLVSIFADVPGTKVLIFGSCFSGGLTDGTEDLPGNLKNTVVLTACGTNEYAYGNDYSLGDAHSLFIGSLIAGLESDLKRMNQPKGALCPNVAKADGNWDCAVTVQEWFDYAKELTTYKIKEITDYGEKDERDKKTGRITVHRNATQTPEIKETQADLAESTVVFRYNTPSSPKHKTIKKASGRTARKCVCDSQGDLRNHYTGTPSPGPAWADISCAYVSIRKESPKKLILEMEVDGGIPRAPTAAFASWHFLLDIDGDRDTGHPGDERPVGVFPELGVDLWADLLYNGIEREFIPALFLGPAGIKQLIPTSNLLQITLNDDRTIVTMEIPTEPLEGMFSSRYGRTITIDEQTMVWAAVTNFSANEDALQDPPSDFFPDEMYAPEELVASRWVAYHSLTSAQYQRRFNQLVAQGFRLEQVAPYVLDGQDFYSGIWVLRDGPDWRAFHGLNAAQYQSQFNQLVAQGFRLEQVAPYVLDGQDFYSGIWVKQLLMQQNGSSETYIIPIRYNHAAIGLRPGS